MPLLLLPGPSTSQEDDNWLSAELRDRHSTEIPNLELQEDGSRGRITAKIQKLPRKKKILVSVVSIVCFLDWQKKRLAASFCAS
jgi:hypothetical protein